MPAALEFLEILGTYRSITSVPEYYESGINFTPSDAETRHNILSDTGAFVAYSGSKTG